MRVAAVAAPAAIVWLLPLASASLFAGYVFQLAVAEQLLMDRLDLALVAGRLNTRGLLLVAAVSALFLLGVLHLQARR